MTRLTVIFLIFALLLLSGCAGCDSAPDIIDTPPEVSPEPVLPPAEPVDEPQEPAGLSFAEHVEVMEGLSYYVKYNNSVETWEEYSRSSMKGVVAHFTDAERLRYESANESGSLAVYLLEEVVYTCLDPGSGWACIEEPLSEAQVDPMHVTLGKIASGYEMPAIESRTVVGIETECFGLTLETEKMEYCFSPEGIPLYLLTEGIGIKVEMEAVVYDADPCGFDFEPPAEPIPYVPSEE